METPSIWKSRKFWLTFADMVVSTATFFITKYLAPQIGNDVLWVIGLWQPMVILLITTYTIQNVEAIRKQ